MERKARLLDGAQGSAFGWQDEPAAFGWQDEPAAGGWQDEPAVVGGVKAYLIISRAGVHFHLLLFHFLGPGASACAETAIFKKSRSVLLMTNIEPHQKPVTSQFFF